MRRYIYIPLLTMIAGIIGFRLREWQTIEAFNAETNLLEAGHPASMWLVILPIVLAIVLIAILTMIRLGGDEQLRSKTPFYCTEPVYITLVVTSSFLFFIAGTIIGIEVIQQVRLWNEVPEYYPLPIALICTSIMAIVAGVASFIVGKSNYREKPCSPMINTLPAYACLPWLIFVYQEHTRDPMIARYMWLLFATAAITISLYLVASFPYERFRPICCIFISLMGVYFSITAFMVGQPLYITTIQLAFVFLILSNAMALLGTCFSTQIIVGRIETDIISQEIPNEIINSQEGN